MPDGTRAPVPANAVVEVFHFEGIELEVVREGGSFRVEATGLARALGYRDAVRMTEAVPDDEKMLLTWGSTLSCSDDGAPLARWWLTEPGLWRALARRRASYIKDDATRAGVERFQHKVFHELIPQWVRKRETEPTRLPVKAPAPNVLQVDVSMATRRQMAIWVLELEDENDRLNVENDRLEVLASSWDDLGEDSYYEMEAAAKILSHAHQIDIGRPGLFNEMSESPLKWIFRSRGSGKWRPYQRAIRRKVLATPLGKGTPIKVTNKGMRELHAHFAKQGRLRLAPVPSSEGRELTAGGAS